MSKGWRRRVWLFIASLLLLSCGEAPQEPLRISSSPWPGNEPLYLARDLGYFNRERVNLYELPSADINLESFRNPANRVAESDALDPPGKKCMQAFKFAAGIHCDLIAQLRVFGKASIIEKKEFTGQGER